MGKVTASYKAAPGFSLQLEMDAGKKTFQTLFAFFAKCSEIFGIKKCGHCQSENLRLSHRKPKGYDYYMVVCEDCEWEMAFGETKEGHQMYPKGWQEPYKGGSASDVKSNSEEDHEPEDEIAF